jgi:hypothetical protein
MEKMEARSLSELVRMALSVADTDRTPQRNSPEP